MTLSLKLIGNMNTFSVIIPKMMLTKSLIYKKLSGLSYAVFKINFCSYTSPGWIAREK